MTSDDELRSEQRYLDRAYEYLEASRIAATAVASVVESGKGGTFQARHERDAAIDHANARLAKLNLGDQSLCFGRIDEEDSKESFYIGRVAIADSENDPVVVDWRAPIAEAFYRATGRDPLGLSRRRHFYSQGRILRGIDDELFGEAAKGLDTGEVSGSGALMSALNESRSGQLSDIVSTIQSEQDEVIRSTMPGVLVVQGGPGTGKTVVALHRAAYLLYSHRFPLEGQGVLVLGPNRLFLSYIEQVLPSLGEAGVEIKLLADLVPSIRAIGFDRSEVARVKGHIDMARLLSRAVRDRQRVLPSTIAIPTGTDILRVSPEDSAQLIEHARRRSRAHNAGRKHVETALFEMLVQRMRNPVEPSILKERIRKLPQTREVLERVWPLLSPAQFLRDLYGSRALLRSAGRNWFSDAELDALYRPRELDASAILWSNTDVPLLDEALELLGPRPKERRSHQIRTYGHIVVDEAQDLSPMELRVVDRRSLNGSLTLVGDIAQATSPQAHDSWESVLRYLPRKREPRRVELRIGYRVPAPSMKLANRVLALAAPGVPPPRSIREAGDEPVIEQVPAGRFDEFLVAAVRREVEAVGSGNVAVIVPPSMEQFCRDALENRGLDFGATDRGRLNHQVNVVEVSLVKGLELDSCIVVEPSAMLEEIDRGPQALYVALTRATKRLSLLHERPLPDVLAEHEGP